MQRAPVRSSDLASVGYDEATQILEVEFRDGSLYQYFDVPRALYLDLVNARSLGKFLVRNIKEKYRYVKVE